ncbi:MAG: PfkB family carbohydrate kinase [Thermoguttaceae bacterium]
MTLETAASTWIDSEQPAARLDEIPQTERFYSIKLLHGWLNQRRAEGCAIVHTHGTFDLLHIGAVRHLEQARQLGGALVVTITPDADLLRTGTRPLFNQELRAEALAALSCVDYVAVAKSGLGPDAIQSICPDVYVPWEENDPGDADNRKLREAEAAIVRALGGRLVALSTGTKIVRLNHHTSPALTPEARDFLNSFRSHYSQDEVAAVLDVARTSSVLFIGETIIDEYQYCESLGKSGKEPVLAVRYVSEEKFAGGVLATANQSAAFCDRIGMVTLLGTKDSHEEFVREKLNPKIDTSFLHMAGARTILKRRMVETYPFQKLFEVYFMDQEIPEAVSKALYARLQAILPRYEAVVVTDYGHGMLTPEIVELLCGSDRFLAVNTQTNAANQGFNSPSKYARADFLCLSEKELRLEVRNRTKDLRLIVAETAERLSCKQMLVTRGRSGSLCYHAKEGFYEIPSFTTRIVDRIGAGDALLAVASLCAAKDVPMEVTGFIGNAVGAQAVETVGNRNVVTPEALARQINDMMSYDHCISTQ